MSDWAVGDLAVCVDASPQIGDIIASINLVEGRIYTVTGGGSISGGCLDRCRDYLLLAEVMPTEGRYGFMADRFRKIRPDEHESCEPEFVTLLKRNRVKA